MEMIIDMDLHPRKSKVYGPFSPEQGRVQDEIEGAVDPSRIAEARDILMSRARLVAEKTAANVVMDAAKREARYAAYSEAPDISTGFMAKLVGVNKVFRGNRASATAAIEGNVHRLVGQLDREMKAAGLNKVYFSRKLEGLWARELHELNREGGRPGITGNSQALQIAKIIRNAQQRAMDALNKEGAFIGNYDGYIAKTTHSSYLLGKKGRDAWLASAMETFDIQTMYPNRSKEFILKALNKQYDRIRAGLHTGHDPAELDLVPMEPGQNLAKRLSENRVIHFKSAEAWLKYISEFSERNPTQIIWESMMVSARHAGLMRIFGTNPKRALETDLQHQMEKARDRQDFDTVERLKKDRWWYDTYMKNMTGEANAVTNQTAASITSNIMTLQRLSKLGFLIFAQLTDASNNIGTFRYNGVGLVDRLVGGATTWFRGAKGSDKRTVSELLNAYVEGELQNARATLETNDPVASGHFTGKLNKIQQWFFKYSGAQPMTDRARGSVVFMLSKHMGQFEGMDWNALGMHERRIMSAYEIGPNEWAAIRNATFTKGNEGRSYLTPDNMHTIPDEAIDAYKSETGRTELREDIRQDLANKLYMYYADQMDYGVLQPRVRENTMMYAGFPPDHPVGIALRLALQFKSFMITQFTRTWGRAWHGEDGPWGMVSGLTQFAVQATILGTFANGLNQLAKGQDPFSQWDDHPFKALSAGFLRSGAASMMGDYFFGEWDRFGHSLPEYILGPTAGSISDFSGVMSKALRGENPSGSALHFARSVTPLTNTVYTKLAVDYLFWNGLVEAANPGYNRRRERRLKKDQGIEYIEGAAPHEFRAF
jgi:hypothetical protein